MPFGPGSVAEEMVAGPLEPDPTARGGILRDKSPFHLGAHERSQSDAPRVLLENRFEHRGGKESESMRSCGPRLWEAGRLMNTVTHVRSPLEGGQGPVGPGQFALQMICW